MTPDLWGWIGLIVGTIVAILLAATPVLFFRWLDTRRWQRAHEWHADREERYGNDGEA